MPVNYSRDFIEHALRIGSLELLPEGRELKSLRLSPYFFNSGKYNSGSSQSALAVSYANAIIANWNQLAHEVIFGPAYKGITLASSVAVELSRLGRDVGFAYNRKEEKRHGEGGIIVGDVRLKSILLIDDVITDGITKDEAMEILRQHEGLTEGLIVAFDRQERAAVGRLSAAQSFDKRHGIPVVSIANCTGLIEYLKKDRSFIPPGIDRSQILEKIVSYQDQYGVN